MATEKKSEKEHHTLEKIEAVGQIIIGEIEKIGGVLTGASMTEAEGDFNINEGISHLKDTGTSDGEKEEEEK